MKKLVLSVVLLGACLVSFAQVGIGTTNPAASSALEISSTTKGVIFPRMTQAQILAIASPAEGLLVYCSDCPTKGLSVFNGLEFINVVSAASLKASEVALIVAAATKPASGNTPSIDALTALGTVNLTATQVAYEEAIAIASPPPASIAELQAIVDDVNSALASTLAFVNSATYPSSGISEAQFSNQGITNLVTANIAAYEAYIALENPKPTTLSSMQAIVNQVNTFLSDNAADVVVSSTGAIWMNKNLGTNRVATSMYDQESYGNHYQWGKAQGFTKDYDVTKNLNGKYQDATAVGTSFVVNSEYPYDWTFNKNNSLWNSGSESVPVKTAQDPCPTGFRVPTITELNHEVSKFTDKSKHGAFASDLKLPAASYRNLNNGEIYSAGPNVGAYWSSSANGDQADGLYITGTKASQDDYYRSFGLSIRCIKE